ncbi:hypothetical protein NP493_385g03031 [Ridgeia piscesae]|uniref:Uncharacterized protein n=1 Tax=Ridgeia piscesae TaxID=27915 RepID=A0AAD9NV09_RIDPI|nr:hypothetical protein NP493_385g03031 [Ridgeia piscesae]
MEGERNVSAHATAQCPESGIGSSDHATMATDKVETSDDGKAEKRMTIENPLDALPKDKGWAWMCLVGGFFVNIIVAGGCFKSFGIIFTAVQDKYQASSAAISKIPAILLAIALGISAPTNWLATRFGTRRIVICGGLLTTTGFLLSAVAEALPVLYLTYGVFVGVGLGLSYAPTVVAVGQYFNKKRATANGLSFAGSGFGAFFIPSLIRFSLDTYGLNGALLLMAGMSLNICVCGMLFRPPQFYMQRYMRRQNRKKTAAKETEKINKLAVDDANKPETDANISSNQDAGANPVDSTDALQEVQLSDYLETEDAKNKQKVLSKPHVARRKLEVRCG